ncbi:MAG: dihydropteroate synthase [Desulfococcaceae bacterium]
MILVADNLTITNPIVEMAIQDMNPEPVQGLVSRCAAAGAEAIDINSGPLTRDPDRRMRFLVEAVQSAADLPILLDTTNPAALKAGLETARGKTIINGFSLEPAKLESILPLAGRYDADIIGYLLYPNSHVPTDEAERLSVAVELFGAFQQTGLPEDRLIIDPVIAPLMWENGHRQDMAILSVLRNLPDLLGFPVRTIAGVSNLITGPGPKDRKRLMEAAYLPMLAASGLTYGLLNVFHTESMRVARACNALMDPKIFTWEGLSDPISS